ncbi:MAG: hypothetical protein E6G12_08220 [Actinobacteria bacterium]|nr:MAG: hypothetical protein E6G12_08220 [Actinomycetota bacterium]
MDSTQKIKRAAATLMVGFLLAIAFAGPAQAGNGKSQGMTAQERKADRIRGQAMNRYYQRRSTGITTSDVMPSFAYPASSTGPTLASERARCWARSSWPAG